MRRFSLLLIGWPPSVVGLHRAAKQFFRINSPHKKLFFPVLWSYLSTFIIYVDKWTVTFNTSDNLYDCGVMRRKFREKGLGLTTEAPHPWRDKTVLAVPGPLLSRHSLLA
jgi:hypothetical protein